MAFLNKSIKRNMTYKKVLLIFMMIGGISWGCQGVVEELTGPSSLGNKLGIVSQPNSIFIGGGSTTISVTVLTAEGAPVQDATVTLTTSLGTLGAASLTTNAGGGATTPLTPGSIRGIAYVTAAIDNITAVTAVSITN
jgi:hypothetical protein